MEKLKIVIVSNDIDAKIKLKNSINDENIAISSFLEYDNMTNLKIIGYNPDVVILVHDPNEGQIFEIAGQVYAQLQGTSVILLSDWVDVELLNKAMQYGIKQVLPLQSTDKEIKEAIYKVHNLEKQRVSDTANIKSTRSKVISFFGGKGGTGKTTIAVNVAVQLALSGKKTAIIDGDLQFGDVTVLLDIDPKSTIYELSKEKGDMGIDVVKSMLCLHSSGLEVLAAPKSPELCEYITDKTMEVIVNTMRPYYEYIIVDLPPGFNDTTIAVIESSDIINMVASVDIIALRNTKLCIGILESLRQKDKVQLILNRSSDGIISKKDFESILNMTAQLCLPDDTKTVLPSLNKGVPFIIGMPKASVSKMIQAYVKTI
ncbi:MAG: AAA family ATPase [Eubacteriales bacterium]|nr:AAA family ATPase [Eubacteriales bacterium]MDD4476312.1 AAA family ATPase [Eubacteriales bacterium]